MVVLCYLGKRFAFYKADKGGFIQTIPPKPIADPTKNDREVYTYKLQKPK